jgi:uncharacterized protein
VKPIDLTAVALVIIGALNWGLVGVAHWDLVAAVCGPTALASVVYSLVGLSGVYLLVRWATGRRPALAVA